MKQVERRIARENILLSWVSSSSVAPSPSVSMIRRVNGWPSSVLVLMGDPHIHNPLVQALIVDPTPNPSDLFKSILLRR